MKLLKHVLGKAKGNCDGDGREKTYEVTSFAVTRKRKDKIDPGERAYVALEKGEETETTASIVMETGR